MTRIGPPKLRPPFAQGVIRCTFRQLIGDALRSNDAHFCSSWPLLEFGRYHELILRYMNVFPRSNIHISLYEDLERAPIALMADLYQFLDVQSNFECDVSQRHHKPSVPRFSGAAYFLKKWRLWSRFRAVVPRSLVGTARSLALRPHGSLVIDPADRTFLTDMYRDEIRKLEPLVNRDLSHWLGEKC